MAVIKRYRFFLVTILMLGLITLVNQDLGHKALQVTQYSIREMLLIIPPIFILLGLLDIWVPRETMMKYMGEGSGLKGIGLAFFIGSAAAGPLYGAFPVAAVFMKKGVKFQNVLIFLGAWSTTKIPMFLFEYGALGARFALTRLLVDIPGIILISSLMAKSVSKEKITALYKQAESL